MLTDEPVSAVELRGDDWAAKNTESHVMYMEQDCANSVELQVGVHECIYAMHIARQGLDIFETWRWGAPEIVAAIDESNARFSGLGAALELKCLEAPFLGFLCIAQYSWKRVTKK